jgi:putative hydrolase of the HAD superfamily
MKRYQAILFDLFSTVALWRPERIPLFEWRGKTSHSTMGALQKVVEEQVTKASFAAFVDGLTDANEELARRRENDMREIPSIERFNLALTKIGYPQAPETVRIAEMLSLLHMDQLAAAVEIPSEHVDFLARLGGRYPIALVSNFDHGPTARAILQRDGAAPYFHPIVISDEHGWRKPHANIFLDTLATLNVDANDSLYVGDSIDDDIVGAKGAGLDIAWVNARAASLPKGTPSPDYTISAIPELAEILLAK